MVKKKAIKLGKRIVRYSLVAFLASLIYFVLTKIYTAIVTTVNGVLGVWIIAVITVLLLAWAFKFHEGEERLFDLLPILVIGGAVTATLKGFNIPVIEQTAIGIIAFSVAVSAVYISDQLILKYVKQLRD